MCKMCTSSKNIENSNLKASHDFDSYGVSWPDGFVWQLIFGINFYAPQGSEIQNAQEEVSG